MPGDRSLRDTSDGPTLKPGSARKPRRMPELLASEEAELRVAWARGLRLGLWPSLRTRRGSLRTRALRSLTRRLARSRQVHMFEAVQTVEDVLGLLADADGRGRNPAQE